MAARSPEQRHRPPGTVRPESFLPRLHYELLVCGLRGHALIGTDAAELRPQDAILARDLDGSRWYRCLRLRPVPGGCAPGPRSSPATWTVRAGIAACAATRGCRSASPPRRRGPIHPTATRS